MVKNKHCLAITEFYAAQRPERSQVRLVAHIDEGVRILDAIGGSIADSTFKRRFGAARAADPFQAPARKASPQRQSGAFESTKVAASRLARSDE